MATQSWRAEAVAIAAGVFLVWRGLFARRRGGLALATLGGLVVARALGLSAGARPARRQRGARRPSPEVVEVKGPGELRPGIASATPEPTLPDRAWRRDPQR